MGSVPSYKALAIIVLGGLGSVPGTLAAALLLGVIEAFGTIYLGDILDRNAIAFAFLIAVLMVRPWGLLGKSQSTPRISTEAARMNMPLVWGAIVVAAVTGSVAYALLVALERRAAFWHPSVREG